MKVLRTTVVGLFLVCSVAGCNPAKKAIEARRADVQAKLTSAQKIGAGVSTLAPVTKDGITTSSPVVLVAADKDDLPTATLVYAEDLAELSAPADHADRLADATLLPECASLLVNGKHLAASNPNVHENVVKSYLDKCKNLTYLLVLRTRKKAAREHEGDVLAFELASGKYLGGFAFSVKSAGRTDKVTNTTTTTQTTTGVTGRRRTTVTKSTSTSYQNSDEDQLRSDLADVIDAGIQKNIPGVKFVD